MTRLTVLGIALAFIAYVGCAEPMNPNDSADSHVTCIGTYDSRAIAVAFVGSKVYKDTAGKELADMLQEYKKAEAEGDTKRVEELKTWGESQQALLHRQGFSTAPVDNVLEYISEQLPKIMNRTGVELLVSKWDAKTLAKYQSAERVDVTMRLVEAFKQNDKQKKIAIEIQKYDPVPLEKMEGHNF